MPFFAWQKDFLTALSRTRVARISPAAQIRAIRLALRLGYTPTATEHMHGDVSRALMTSLDCSSTEAQRLARAHADTMYRAGLLWYGLRLADRAQIEEFLRDSVRVEHADRLLDLPAGPTIVFSAHYGLPIAGALATAKLLQGRTRLNTFFASPKDNPSTAGYAELLGRSGFGVNCILVNARATVLALRALKAGEALTMQPDVYDNRYASAVLVPFLNSLAYVMTGTAYLALRSGARVVPAFTRVERDGRVVFTYDPPLEFTPTGDEAKDLYRLTCAIHRAIEAQVRAAPEQWVYWQILDDLTVPGVVLPANRTGDDDAWRGAYLSAAGWASRVVPTLRGVLDAALESRHV